MINRHLAAKHKKEKKKIDCIFLFILHPFIHVYTTNCFSSFSFSNAEFCHLKPGFLGSMGVL